MKNFVTSERDPPIHGYFHSKCIGFESKQPPPAVPTSSYTHHLSPVLLPQNQMQGNGPVCHVCMFIMGTYIHICYVHDHVYKVLSPPNGNAFPYYYVFP